MPSKEMLVFADESGNTGTNFLDDEQRWYVVAAIAVETNKADELRGHVEALRQQVGSAELKGSRLLATRRNREHVGSLIHVIGNFGVPFVVGLEKRFNLAGRFDYIVSDPKANRRVTWQRHLDREARRSTAAALARMPLDTMTRIQDALRDAQGTDWSALVMECAARMRELGEDNLAYEMEGAKDATREDLFGANPQFDAKDMTVNEAAFTSLLQLIDQAAVSGGIDVKELVHDETTSFEATFAAVHERLGAKKEEAAVILDAEGNKIWPLMAINNLRFAVSKDEPIVQAADVLAATVAWVCGMEDPGQYRGEQAAKSIAVVITAMCLSKIPRLFHFLGSDEDLSKFVRTLAELQR